MIIIIIIIVFIDEIIFKLQIWYGNRTRIGKCVTLIKQL